MLVQGDEEFESNIEFIGDMMSMSKLPQRKYLLSLKGNGIAAGLEWMLYSQSAVFIPRLALFLGQWRLN